MTPKKSRHKMLLSCALSALFFPALLTGCASLRGDSATSSEGFLTSAPKSKIDAPSARYYDFDDVMIPVELNIDRRKSFVNNNTQSTVGMLAFNGGRLELDDLVKFFETNMTKDNWRQAGSIRSPRTLLFFTKPTRTCIIDIYDGQFKTEVGVWVSPAEASK